MIAEKMVKLVKNSSIIRAMFEEGQRLGELYGKDNVYDFSLGNPNVEAPAEVKEAILACINKLPSLSLHGYMENIGYKDVRKAVADSTNKKFGTAYTERNIIMTVGAAGGLNVILKTLLNPDDEVIAFAPYFGEYGNYVDNFSGRLVVIPARPPHFLPDLDELKKRITPRTKAVIFNNPNNPTGLVYGEETIKALSAALCEKEKELSTSIYLLSDEPYRELVYGDTEVPFIPNFYHNTIVGYSFSKSLSLPGERIGYLIIPSNIDDYKDVFEAAGVATRILGFVNAPSLMQRVAASCLSCKCDVEYYGRNGKLLYDSLTEYGYECLKPQGAFYLFVKSPLENEKEFCAIAKEYNLLLVAGSAFGAPGYIRIAYCTSYEMIQASLPAFKKAIERVK